MILQYVREVNKNIYACILVWESSRTDQWVRESSETCASVTPSRSVHRRRVRGDRSVPSPHHGCTHLPQELEGHRRWTIIIMKQHSLHSQTRHAFILPFIICYYCYSILITMKLLFGSTNDRYIHLFLKKNCLFRYIKNK